MAIAQAQERIAPPLLTYEEYLSEDTIQERYDIVDGVREFMNPTRRHQKLLGNLYELFRAYERQSKNGNVVLAPCDVLIHYTPLRTRQPGLLYIGKSRLAQNPPQDDPQPLSSAPELVVEILSPSDKPSVLNAKIADYCAVDVLECWLVHTEKLTVEILQLTPTGSRSVAVYVSGQTVQSLTFSNLSIAVDAICAE